MKITIEFDVELDGDISEGQAKEIFFERLIVEPILSEDWAILINGWELKENE